MKENTHVIPVVKIVQTLMSEPRWKTRIRGLKNPGAINLLFKFFFADLFFPPEFPLSICFVRLANVSEYHII